MAANINTAVFTLKLKDAIEQGVGTCGLFDGSTWSLAVKTSGGLLLLYSPSTEQQYNYLHVNKTVTALAAGALDPTNPVDILLIGSTSSLQAYNVLQNSDVFFLDLPGSVHSIIANTTADSGWPVVLAGGQGFVMGCTLQGQAVLHITISDTATALGLVDVDGDGRLELVVGSSDGYLRVYRQTTLIEEIKEADKVVSLAPLGSSAYGYGLANGTTGTYQGMKRRWRLKSKHALITLVAFDLDGDGHAELVSGWANGKVECRRPNAGEVVMRDNMPTAIAAFVLLPEQKEQGEPAQQGKITQQPSVQRGMASRVAAVAVDGEVRGYAPNAQQQQSEAAALTVQLEDLKKVKQELLYELHAYEYCNTIGFGEATQSGLYIPANTSLEFMMEVKPGNDHITLVLLTTSSTLLRGAVVFAEKVFSGESSFVFPKQPSTTIKVPLQPKEDTPIHMLAKVLISSTLSPLYQVFELDIKLPKYSMFALMPPGAPLPPLPSTCVTFSIKDRAARLALWVQSNFIISDPQHLHRADGDIVDCCFHCLRDATPLYIQMNTQHKGQVQLYTDNLALAASLVQDIAVHFSLGDLNPLVEAPHVTDIVAQHLATIENCRAMQQHIVAESAESAAAIKALVVKAEDARLLRDAAGIKASYSALHKINSAALNFHASREALHTQLLAAHKNLNSIIQDAAGLRVGGPKAKTLAACHQALQQGHGQAAQHLAAIIRAGMT